jgi:hypothetical protein
MEVKITGGTTSSSLTLNAQKGKRTKTMPETITNGITKCGEGSNNEERYQLFPGFSPNPPDDGRCMCCGKRLSELKPFSRIGQHSGMDIEGVLLVKKVRPTALATKEVDDILEGFCDDRLTAEDQEKAEERQIELLGKEVVDDLLVYYDSDSLLMDSWECLECIGLDDEAYRAMLASRNSQDTGDSIH